MQRIEFKNVYFEKKGWESYSIKLIVDIFDLQYTRLSRKSVGIIVCNFVPRIIELQ